MWNRIYVECHYYIELHTNLCILNASVTCEFSFFCVAAVVPLPIKGMVGIHKWKNTNHGSNSAMAMTRTPLFYRRTSSAWRLNVSGIKFYRWKCMNMRSFLQIKIKAKMKRIFKKNKQCLNIFYRVYFNPHSAKATIIEEKQNNINK